VSGFDAVQRVVLQTPRGDHVAHVVLSMPSAQAGRGFLRRLAASKLVAFGLKPDRADQTEVSIGLTFRGLQSLLVPRGYLAAVRRISRAFVEGAPARAAAHLGDTGCSAVSQWRKAFDQEQAQILVSVQAQGCWRLGRALTAIRRMARAEKMGWCQPMLGARLAPPEGAAISAHGVQSWVHFGYRDGLSRVRIRGLELAGALQQRVHEPGEFILGYPNDHGSNPGQMPNAPRRIREFFRCGSFGVLRVIKQDVDAFNARVDAWARQVAQERLVNLKAKGGAAEEQALTPWREYVKAKLCGRWPDGRLFDASGERPCEGTDTTADFFHAADALGQRCPLGAHIRRMNPREAPGDAQSEGVAHSRVRALIRRGLPYGDWRDCDRGLLAWFFCASIEDQFEHLVGQWGDRPPLGVAVSGKDPLIGQHTSDAAAFVVPRADDITRPHRLTGLQPFCTTRGTLYAFYPSRSALQRLADEDYDLKNEPEDDAV
jgi:hypothetical protein